MQQAIRASHERWDGAGRPHGLAMTEIPEEALIVSAAHWVLDQVADDENPLRIRARLQATSAAQLAGSVGPRVADALTVELRADAVWMSFWSERLPAIVATEAAGSERSTVKTVERVAAAFGALVDSAQHGPGRSERVAALAAALGDEAGLRATHRRALAVRGTAHGRGRAGGAAAHHREAGHPLAGGDGDHAPPSRVGARLLEQLPGFEPIAAWVEFHHERPDGRGYPEMLEGSAIPLASSILGAADAYWALRAERPYRAARNSVDALAIMEEAAGEQFDETVVGWIPRALGALPGELRELPPHEGFASASAVLQAASG